MVQSHKQDAYQEKDKIRLKKMSLQDKVYLVGRAKDKKMFIHKQRRNRAYFYSDAPNKVKNTRLYKEVRYARFTITSLKPTAAVFRLKKPHKNLES